MSTKKSVPFKLDPSLPYEDQINFSEAENMCEEFGKSSTIGNPNSLVGYSPSSHHCISCGLALMCMKLAVKPDDHISIRKIKRALDIPFFYDEFKVEDVEDLYNSYMLTIKSVSSQGKEIGLQKLKERVYKDFKLKMNSEVQEFCDDFVARILSNENIELKNDKIIWND